MDLTKGTIFPTIYKRFIGALSSKKNYGRAEGDASWRGFLLGNILGSEGEAEAILRVGCLRVCSALDTDHG